MRAAIERGSSDPGAVDVSFAGLIDHTKRKAREGRRQRGPDAGAASVRDGAYRRRVRYPRSWRLASLARCPLHPRGGCGFARHGTYERMSPPGTQIARWYCPQGHRTFSLLPDHLAARFPGTLSEIEQVVATVEQAQQPGGGRRPTAPRCRHAAQRACAGYAGAWLRCARCSRSWWDCCPQWLHGCAPQHRRRAHAAGVRRRC